MSFVKGQGQLNTGRTWWIVGHIPWNKGKKYINPKTLTGWSIICIVCGKSKYYQVNEHKKRLKRYCSPHCYHLNSRKEKLVYSAIHSRLIRDWGKADLCDNCNSSKTVDWANVSGKYLLIRSDWKKLCRKCHIAYDKDKNDLAYKKFISLRR